MTWYMEFVDINGISINRLAWEYHPGPAVGEKVKIDGTIYLVLDCITNYDNATVIHTLNANFS